MSFDVAAEAYESFMGRYSRPLAVEFADWAGLPASGRALDVGCGPGALLEVLAARWGEERISAIDPSESFVAAARSRFPRADVRLAAAEQMPFADGGFDATLAELVVHLMKDAAAGVREMHRVTRRGGVVAACVWDFAGRRAPHTRFFDAFSSVVPDVEDETRRVGVRSGGLGEVLRTAGCDGVVEGELTVRIEFAGFDDWWEPYTLGVGPAGGQFAAASPAARDATRERAREMVPDGPFTIGATAWAARGTA